MIIGESTCDVTRVARHSTIVVKVVTRATLLSIGQKNTDADGRAETCFY